PGAAVCERLTNTYSDQLYSHVNDREADLFHGFEGGLHGRLAELDMTMNVLEHDNGVVHDHADRQHERQHGEDIDGIAEEIKQGKGADDRDWNGDGRDDGRAEAA